MARFPQSARFPHLARHPHLASPPRRTSQPQPARHPQQAGIPSSSTRPDAVTTASLRRPCRSLLGPSRARATQARRPCRPSTRSARSLAARWATSHKRPQPQATAWHGWMPSLSAALQAKACSTASWSSTVPGGATRQAPCSPWMRRARRSHSSPAPMATRTQTRRPPGASA